MAYFFFGTYFDISLEDINKKTTLEKMVIW